MKKNAISGGRPAAGFPIRRTSGRPRQDAPDQTHRERRRPREDPFRDRDLEGPRAGRHGPLRHDRRSSRNQLRTYEQIGWKDAVREDDAIDESEPEVD